MKKVLMALLLSTVALFSVTAYADPGCKSADIIGPKMITDVCWTCIFPLRVAGMDISGSGGRVPDGAAKNPLCMCDDPLGIPAPGITMSMWEPARLVEFQTVPGCSSVLNGIRFPFDRMNQGTHSSGDFDGSDGSFMHYHYYAYPLLHMLDMFVQGGCNPDGFIELDVMYMSEVDPTWNNDQLAFFTNPEAAAVASVAATLACSADAIASTAGRPIKEMFWCAGTWGTLYPLSGFNNGGKGVLRDSSLLKTRVLAALHRRGLAWRTMGEDAMCRGLIDPTLPKTQYKFTLMFPVAETDSAHTVGEPELVWGVGKTIPGFEDPVYMVWRWNDCCATN